MDQREARMHVDVAFLPDDVTAERLQGGVAVVIDVLRATTTIAAMLEAGARVVMTAATIEEAASVRRSVPGAVLCGERGGFPPEGFDYGNSPVEFSRMELGGKTMVLTTTNGTRAVAVADAADLIVAGAVVNADAVARTVAARSSEAEGHEGGGSCILICAGTEGSYSIDDVYAAGLIARALEATYGRSTVLTDAAWSAALIAAQPIDMVVSATTCRHVRTLFEKGLSHDVAYALRAGASSCVPVYDRQIGGFAARRIE